MCCNTHSPDSPLAAPNVTGVYGISAFVTSTVESRDAVHKPEGHPSVHFLLQPFLPAWGG